MGFHCDAKCRILMMLCLTFSFFLVEIIVGYLTNSTALIADSFHMLSDVIALVIAFVSIRMSPKKWSKNTFGWARAEVLGALINSVFLLALCFSILIESFKRFIKTEALHNPKLLLLVGIVGLVINIIGLFLFHDGHGHSHGGSPSGHLHVPSQEKDGAELNAEGNDTNVPERNRRKSRNMNMHGVFLHVLADALGSVIVIVSALVVLLTEWKFKAYVDPGLSVIMVAIITQSTLPLLRDSALILLQTVPTHIQIDSLQSKLLKEIDGVLAVHEFHVWQLAGDRIIASAHIRCRNLHDYMQIAEKVKEFFHNEGIHSTTIQPEFVELDQEGRNKYSTGSLADAKRQWSGKNGEPQVWSDKDCALDCPPGQRGGCVENTCCGPQQIRSGSLEATDVENTNPGSVVVRRNRRAPAKPKQSTDLDEIAFESVQVLDADPGKVNHEERLGQIEQKSN